jgi:hypothetical protein
MPRWLGPSKYDPLTRYLAALALDEVTLTLGEAGVVADAGADDADAGLANAGMAGGGGEQQRWQRSGNVRTSRPRCDRRAPGPLPLAQAEDSQTLRRRLVVGRRRDDLVGDAAAARMATPPSPARSTTSSPS